MSSISLPFEQCMNIIIRHVRMENGVGEPEAWCHAHAVPIVIVSSGMEPLIHAVLRANVGERGDGRWELVYHHPQSVWGYDKNLQIQPYRELAHRPFLFFLGDGVSDWTSTCHAELLLVEHKPSGGNDLEVYCLREGPPHVLFEDFHGAQRIIRGIVTGAMTKEQALAMAIVRA